MYKGNSSVYSFPGTSSLLMLFTPIIFILKPHFAILARHTPLFPYPTINKVFLKRDLFLGLVHSLFSYILYMNKYYKKNTS